MITIRTLDVSQIEQFVDVHLRCWEETYLGIFPSDVVESRARKKMDRISHIEKRILEHSNYFYYCLYDELNIVGIMIFSIIDGVGVLDAIYLKREYQRKNYGKKMIGVLERVLETKHISKYYIYVFKNIPSHHFFQKIGAKYCQEDLISIHGRDYIEFEYVKEVGMNE